MADPSNIAVSVVGLTKIFKKYAKPSDVVKEFVTGRQRHKPICVLKDVSFELTRGQVIGILGKNGAGKSTLLKILAGTLTKTSGTVDIQGKISAILELGTGFHPEYSGRENIIMGGLCLGMTKQDIQRKMESIIDFSELRERIDDPFKTYSSGMQARLTFSTAVAVEPDILIIDEALAVGDATFVGKCLRRIKKITESGATVLFVSHSTEMVRLFCQSAIWLDRGEVVLQGSADNVTKAYDRFVYEQSEPSLQGKCTSATEFVNIRNLRGELDANFFKYGNHDIKIVDCKFCDAEGNPRGIVRTGDHVELHIHYEGELKNSDEQCYPSVQIFSPQGILVASAGTRLEGRRFAIGKRGVFKFVLSPLLLGNGQFFFSPYLASYNSKGEVYWLDFHDRAYSLLVKGLKQQSTPEIIEHPCSWKHAVLDYQAKPEAIAG